MLHQRGSPSSSAFAASPLHPAPALPVRACRTSAASPPFTRSAAGALIQRADKVAIFVEPSPFSHVSGMKNRFECLIRGLREAGDEVLVVTPDPRSPKEFCGAKVVNVLGFKLPFYSSPTLLLSLGLSLRVLWYLMTLRPDLIHVSSPGVMVFAVTLYSKLLRIPLVVSYHTHIPEYIPRYTWGALVHPMWTLIRWCTRQSDLTLVTSQAMKQELSRNLCRGKSIDVWQRGVDTEVFHPRFRNAAMRAAMTDGHPNCTLLTYVGRLGAEKNLHVLRDILAAVPNARLALVGDGPSRAELEKHFAGLPVKFMGMLKGDALSAAYASADIFLMPSETETLGFVVLEAMASGVPVVAVAAGGLTDILTPVVGEAAAAAATPETSSSSSAAADAGGGNAGVEADTTAPYGYLYPSGDYQQAALLTQRLAADPLLRGAVGVAGRREMERWGWGAATKTLRELQYSRAIKFNRNRRRFWFLALRMGLAQQLRRFWGALVGALLAAKALLLSVGQPQPATHA